MGELDDLREEIEDLREEIQELKENSEDSEEEDSEDEDETRTLYIYIQYIYEEDEIMGMEVNRKKLLLLEKDNSYEVPHEVEAEFASTTRQAISYIQNLGIDCWDAVRRTGERENAVYYTVILPEEVAGEVNEGAWVSEKEATQLVSDMEAREYL